jgi:hypothetical protein
MATFLCCSHHCIYLQTIFSLSLTFGSKNFQNKQSEDPQATYTQEPIADTECAQMLYMPESKELALVRK